MILARAPLRVSLFGGGSDYPEHFLRRGGAVLGLAINRYVYCGVKAMPPGQTMRAACGKDVPIRYRVQYSRVDDCQNAGEIQHPAVRAAVRYLRVEQPTEFHIFADLPGRSGLGGSSAFCVALLSALLDYLVLQRPGGAPALAAEAIAFERHVIGEEVGFQDQMFAASGGMLYGRFGLQSTVEPIRISEERLRALEDSLVLAFTGTMRDSHVMAARQIASVDQNEERLREMQILTDAARYILEHPTEDLNQIGALLARAWALKRALDRDISSPAIDGLYQRGIAAGALGGKLLGAGGGGYMLFFVPPAARAWFEQRVDCPCVRVRAAPRGCELLVREAS